MLTPEMAAELLQGNTCNRPTRQAHINRLALQIARGKWRFNGDTIKISDAGVLLDGQHRLWAVVEAHVAVETIIVRGIKRDAFATIDTGRASRTGSDILALAGVTRYRTVLSASLRWLVYWQRGIEHFRDPHHRVENSDIEMAWSDHPDMAAAVDAAMRLHTVMNPSMLAMLYYVFSQQNRGLADYMMSVFAEPGPIAIDDPFLQLRQWVIKQHKLRKEPLKTIAFAIKAANAAHRSEGIRQLSYRQGHEPFPTLRIGRAP